MAAAVDNYNAEIVKICATLWAIEAAIAAGATLSAIGSLIIAHHTALANGAVVLAAANPGVVVPTPAGGTPK